MSAVGDVIVGALKVIVGLIVFNFTLDASLLKEGWHQMTNPGFTPIEPPPTDIRDVGFNRTEQGTVIPVVYGNYLTWPMMVWIGNFDAKEKGGQASGEKGEQPTPSTVTYEGDFALGISEGPIHDIDKAWRGEKNITDAKNGGGAYSWYQRVGGANEETWSPIVKKEGEDKAFPMRWLAKMLYTGSIGKTNTIPRMAVKCTGRILDHVTVRADDEDLLPDSTQQLPELLNLEYDSVTGYIYGAETGGARVARIPREGDQFDETIDFMDIPDSSVLGSSGYTASWAGYWWRRNMVAIVLRKSGAPTLLALGHWGVNGAVAADWTTHDLGNDGDISSFSATGTEQIDQVYLCSDSGVLLISTQLAGVSRVTRIDCEEFLINSSFAVSAQDHIVPASYVSAGDQKLYVCYIPHLDHVIVAGTTSGSPNVARFGYFIFGQTDSGYLHDEVTHTQVPLNSGALIDIEAIRGIGWWGDTLVTYRPYVASTDGEAAGAFIEVSFEDEDYISRWKQFSFEDSESGEFGDIGDYSIPNTATGIKEYTSHHTLPRDPSYVSFDNMSMKFTMLGVVSASYPVVALQGGQALYTTSPNKSHWSVTLPNGDHAIYRFELNRGCPGPVYDMLSHTRYGGGIPDSEIDLQSFEVAEGWTSSRILKDAEEDNEDKTVARHDFNYAVESQNRLSGLCEEFMASWGGFLVETGEQIVLGVRRPVAGYTEHFTRSNILAGSLTATPAAARSLPNRVRVRYYAATGVKKKNRHRIATANFEFDQDVSGEIRTLAVEGTGLIHQSQARRLARTLLNEAWSNRIIAEFSSTPRAINVRPGDTIAITHDRYGWVKKLFWVLQRSEDTEGNWNFRVQEHNPRVYDIGVRDLEEVDTEGFEVINYDKVPYPGRFYTHQWKTEVDSLGNPAQFPRLRAYFSVQPSTLHDYDQDEDFIHANGDAGGNYAHSFVEWGLLIFDEDEDGALIPQNDNQAYSDGTTAEPTSTALLAAPLSASEIDVIRVFSLVSRADDHQVPTSSLLSGIPNLMLVILITDYNYPGLGADDEDYTNKKHKFEAIQFPVVAYGVDANYPGGITLRSKVGLKITRAYDGQSGWVSIGAAQDFSFSRFSTTSPTMTPLDVDTSKLGYKFLVVPSEVDEDSWGGNDFEDSTAALALVQDYTNDLYSGGAGLKIFRDYSVPRGGSDWLYIGDTRAFNSLAFRIPTPATSDCFIEIEYCRLNNGLIEWWPLSVVVDRTLGFSQKKNNIVIPEIDSAVRSDYEFLTFSEPEDWVRTYYIRSSVDEADPLLAAVPIVDPTNVSDPGYTLGGYFWIRIRRTRPDMKTADLPILDRIVHTRRPFIAFREDRAAYIESDGSENPQGAYRARAYHVGTVSEDHPVAQRPTDLSLLLFILASTGGSASDTTRTDTQIPRISELKINGKPGIGDTITVDADSAITLSWYLTSQFLGFGLQPFGGHVFGGSAPSDFVKTMIRVYNKSDDTLLREIEIEDSSISEYTYRVSANTRDNGTWNGSLRFEMIQVTARWGTSLPVEICTGI